MIDFHNHILPNTDDGAKNIDISLDMLRLAEKQGIKEIVNTVHFQHPKMDGLDISYDRVMKILDNLKTHLDSEGIDIKIHIGAEVYFQRNLSELIDNKLVTFGFKKYMLVEFPVISFPPGYKEELFSLDLKGITPIIAHPERYREIHENIEILKFFYDKGYLIQLDAGSILGDFGIKVMECANKIVSKGYFHLIGSDAHNNSNRNFCLDRVANLNNSIISNNFDTIFFHNPSKVLRGEKLSSIVIPKKHGMIGRIKNFLSRE